MDVGDAKEIWMDAEEITPTTRSHEDSLVSLTVRADSLVNSAASAIKGFSLIHSW